MRQDSHATPRVESFVFVEAFLEVCLFLA